MRQERGLSDLIEIRDPAIDAREVIARIRANIEARHAAGHRPPTLSSFGLPSPPSTQDATLQYHLTQANETYNQIWVEVSLAPSLATQVPILGRLWGLIRKQAHRLVLYYVEMLASKQMSFNEHVVGALNRLAVAQEEMAALREEVAELRRLLAALEN